jgi:hypothetical protein
MQYFTVMVRIAAEHKALGARLLQPKQGNVERASLADEVSRAQQRGKALGSENPMSGGGTKQGREAQRGYNPQGSEKDRRGIGVRVEPNISRRVE